MNFLHTEILLPCKGEREILKTLSQFLYDKQRDTLTVGVLEVKTKYLAQVISHTQKIIIWQ